MNSPWHVRVQSNSKWLQCSGAIVNSSAVVTAASCLLVSGNLLRVSQLSVVAGSAGLYTLDSNAMSTNVRHQLTALLFSCTVLLFIWSDNVCLIVARAGVCNHVAPVLQRVDARQRRGRSHARAGAVAVWQRGRHSARRFVNWLSIQCVVLRQHRMGQRRIRLL